MHFTRAIVRPPSRRFAEGLTSVELGPPDVGLALAQHAAYCEALERCGLELTRLPADDAFPDSTFVEDTAVLMPDCAVLTRPGAPSRTGEVEGIAPAVRAAFASVCEIAAPGTLDGGDVCLADGHFFIGVSERTNEHGARQLATIAADRGFTSTLVDVRDVPGILHLKSGLSALGSRRLALIDTLIGRPEFAGYDVVRVPPRERYAANCLRINDHLIVARGHPQFETAMRASGCAVIALDMSEFRKMDGALTCLSLRF